MAALERRETDNYLMRMVELQNEINMLGLILDQKQAELDEMEPTTREERVRSKRLLNEHTRLERQHETLKQRYENAAVNPLLLGGSLSKNRSKHQKLNRKRIKTRRRR